jgi:hypothetical protein
MIVFPSLLILEVKSPLSNTPKLSKTALSSRIGSSALPSLFAFRSKWLE